METNETPGRPLGRPKTFDRERVLDIAMESYWHDGPSALSLNEICRRAAVSKPVMYREFGGEDGLMDAVLERYADVVLAPLLAGIEHDRPFGDVLNGVAEALTDVTRPGPAGCLLAKLQHSPSALGAAVDARAGALRAAARAHYGALVDQAKRRGEIAADIPTAVAAAFIDIQCGTLLMQMSLGEDPDLLCAQAKVAFAGLTAAHKP